jgi:tetratricopeptide (TPR) repeat protein
MRSRHGESPFSHVFVTLVRARSVTSEHPQDVNDHAPFTACTAGTVGGRRNGPYPLMAPRVLPAGIKAAATGVAARGVAWPVRAGAVPPPAVSFKVRTDSVPRVEALLDRGAAIALVSGPENGGDAVGWLRSCGKTQLAVYLAEALWQSREIELLAWVTASDRASVLSGYAEAAAQLGLDDGGDAEEVAARFLGWLGSTARSWLVVLDDLRDATDLDGLLPGGPAGQVLLTAVDAEMVSGTRQVTVPAFSLREAMAYLSGRLTSDPEGRSGAYDLAEDLCGEPAALAQAGAVMAGSGTGCRSYQGFFARQRERLRSGADGRLPSAAVTWMLSADYAEELLPGGGTWPLLLLAALLDSHGIPRAVLTSPAACRYLADAGTPSPDRQHAQSAVLALERAGLVSVGPAVYVSRPLQRTARAAAPAELLGRAVLAAADAVLEAWPDDQPRSVLAAQLRACTASLLRHVGDGLWDGGSCHRVLLTAGRSLGAAGLAGPAVTWWREVAVRSERLLGPDHRDTLIAAGYLTDALLVAGQHAEAVECGRWVVDGRDRVLGPGHPAAIVARISLGRALAGSAETGEALRVLRDAAARSERAYSHGDPHVLAVLDEYATAFLAAGDTATALRFCKRSLGDREQALGPADPATLAAAIRLADTCLAHGKAKDAIGQYQRVLAAREQALGPDHPDTLSARASLAAGYDTAGQIGDALREHQQACAGYGRTFGPDHPFTLSCRAALARAYYAAGQLGDALAELRDSTSRAEQALSPGDPVTRSLRQALHSITADLAGE